MRGTSYSRSSSVGVALSWAYELQGDREAAISLPSDS